MRNAALNTRSIDRQLADLSLSDEQALPLPFDIPLLRILDEVGAPSHRITSDAKLRDFPYMAA